MSGFHNCRACITEVACEKAARCFNGSSALPPPEPQGHCERSGLATCSLPVSLVLKAAAQMEDAAHDSPRNCANALRWLAQDLRAHAARASVRQPEENT